jgi:hypothetical protein
MWWSTRRPTPPTRLSASPGLDRFFLHHPGANDTPRRDVRYDVVGQAR